jgi:alpha-L-fucosidase
MGAWLKKYGEAVYSTRAWDIYGEGPTKMGAAHGVFQEPAEGTEEDVRFTRSKDNSILYAILLGWKPGQRRTTFASLASSRIDCKNLESVELINGGAGVYKTLQFKQDESGLVVELPERPFEDLAYVVKLTFKGEIPAVASIK